MESFANEDTYPMPLFPQLRVADLSISLEWYHTVGFEVIYEMPVMAHVRYRRYADVMLVEDGLTTTTPAAAAGGARGGGVTVYLTLEDDSLEELVERAARDGVEPEEGPRETGWNTNEAHFLDPDGYRFAFAEVADPTRTFDDVMDPSGG